MAQDSGKQIEVQTPATVELEAELSLIDKLRDHLDLRLAIDISSLAFLLLGKGAIRIITPAETASSWRTRIADTGAGISANARDKMFDIFFTTKAIGKGTGQGLSIAHGVVVKKPGGTLNSETDTGKGTTFVTRIHLGRQHSRGLRDETNPLC